MTPTLEQELDALIVGSDYRVRLVSDAYLHVSVHYVPSVVTVDMGGKLPLVVESGRVGHKLFAGPPRWRYWRARRYVRRTIEGHRRLLAEGVRTI